MFSLFINDVISQISFPVKECFTQIDYTAEIGELQINDLEKSRNFLKIQDPAGSRVLKCISYDNY
jgi:hypothetical protein